MTTAEIIDLAFEWLEKLDQENYSLCWRSASPELKLQISETDFIAIMADKQMLQERIVSRELVDEGGEMTYFKRPELLHRVLKFDVKLVSGNSCQELVTLVEGQERVWRVANYTRL